MMLLRGTGYRGKVTWSLPPTFKGSVDSIDGIQAKLKGRIAYLHLDAALFGGYLPHTQFAADLLHETRNPVTGENSNATIQSLFHAKSFLDSLHPQGCSSPPGQTLNRSARNSVRFMIRNISCKHPARSPVRGMRSSRPNFISSARNRAFARQAADAKTILDNAGYLLQEMTNHYSHLQPTRANDRSNTIYFRKPGETVVNKYCLATMRLDADEQLIPCAHVVVMPHVN
jgi:histidine decarboxylase